MKAKYLYSLLFCLFFTTNMVIGQMDTLQVKIMGKSFGDSIALRWAPLNYATWEAGKKYGYLIEKVTIKQLKQKPIREKLNDGKPIFPISLAEWEILAQGDDQAGAAAELLYGEPAVPEGVPEAIRPFKLKEQKDNLFGFGLLIAEQNFDLAAKMGLGLWDKSIQSNNKYFYKIFPAGGEAAKIDTASVYIEPNYQEPLPAVELTKVAFSDYTVSLTWNFKKHQHIYFGYRVERSVDGGQTYNAVSETPIIPLKKPGDKSPFINYLDSLPANKVFYDYRVRGLTAFDEIGPSANSKRGKGIPKKLDAFPIITDAFENVDKAIDLTWHFPEELETKIKGFQIFQSDTRKGKKLLLNDNLLPSSTRNYQDKTPKLINFYTVVAIDENDHVLTSARILMQLKDEAAPALPMNLKGSIDEHGVLVLNWDKNIEEDLKGYQVYTGNGPDVEFAQISNKVIGNPTFSDSVNINTLASFLYFKVKAVDFRDNYSGFSEVIAVPIPDLIPPVAPVWKKTKATEKGVELAWASSSSTDVIEEVLQRSLKGTNNWETIYTSNLENPIQTVYDTTATYQYQYEYRVTATDAAELMTENQIVTLKPIDNGIRKSIDNYIVKVKDEQIVLEWNYPEDLAVTHFLIYKGQAEAAPSLFKKIKPTALEKRETSENSSLFTFRDSGSPKSVLSYQVIAKHEDGGYSPLTEIKTVEIK